MARFVACVGFATTVSTIVISVIPSPDEANKVLAAGKIVGLTGVVLGVGWILFYLGKRRRVVAGA